VTDFVNFKIKSIQFFRCAHKGRVCMHIFIELSDRTYMSICVYNVFFFKKVQVGKKG
jgi:hypothetical protein